MTEKSSPYGNPERELALLRLVTELGDQLESMRDVDKALRIALRMAKEHFQAELASLAILPPGEDKAQRTFSLPAEAPFPVEEYSAFLLGERLDLSRDTLFVPIRRWGRLWAACGFCCEGREFDRGLLREAARLSSTISNEVQRIDLLRTAEVRARIDRKIMEQLRPKDLFYQILHGLRSLTHYDHSASILISGARPGTLELVAEQVAWRKGKSRRIGRTVQLQPQDLDLLAAGEVYGFERAPGDQGKDPGGWRAWRGTHDVHLAEALEMGSAAGAGEEHAFEGSMLCAPLATRDGLLGVLKVTARNAGALGPYEADLVQRFRPQASIALRNLHRAATLQTSVLEAEKKTALADLARGVSHDVNNAFGSVLPLVQQLLADAREGRVDLKEWTTDLEQIEASLQICRRIFSGMLGFAKVHGDSIGGGNVLRAVEATLGLLNEGMQRQGIRVDVDLPEDLPHVNATQSELEQLVLNIASNARDAMSAGGSLSVQAEYPEQGHQVRLYLRDTGLGISPEQLALVREPFYTTKPTGSGLGLAVCRSILRKMGGRMDIESEPGEGTCVRLDLPIASVARIED